MSDQRWAARYTFCDALWRGRARVVTDPKTAEVRVGEILVAERTDPGWILLFAGAAGVVAPEVGFA